MDQTGTNGEDALSADRIVDVALERIEADGASALTMRNIAKALGSTPMALYRHVRDKAELESLVADRVLDGVAIEAQTGDWRQQLAGLHEALRRALLRRPGVGTYVLGRWSRSRGRAAIQDRVYGVLREAGFEGPDVVIAADALELYTLGSICHDLSDSLASSVRQPSSGRLAHVSVEATPNLVEYAVYLVKRDADVMFASGYAALLAGLEAALAGAEAT